MLELRGKYTNALVYTDMIEEEAISQIIGLCNHPVFKDAKIRIMPDVHAGAGCTIGTTIKLKEKKIIPNLVGVDIGCFTIDTKVWTGTSYKTFAELMELNQSFMVESYDSEIDGFIMCKAVAKQTRKNAELIKVVYGSKTNTYEVKCTLDHKFMLNNKTWVEAKDLKTGMQLMYNNDGLKPTEICVKETCILEEKQDVYCLTVEDTHNFLIEGGIVVHNCGVLTTLFKVKEEIDFKALDDFILSAIPNGCNVRNGIHKDIQSEIKQLISEVVKNLKLGNLNYHYDSCGTLGGGNHYIEIGKIDEDTYALSVHSGSRNLGKQVCEYFQKEAVEHMKAKEDLRKLEKELIERLKNEGRAKEISSELENLKKTYQSKYKGIPVDLAFIEGETYEQYIENMIKCQKVAVENRRLMAKEILSFLNAEIIDQFQTIHNYIEDIDGTIIIRKGAIRANSGEKVAIPLNMKDGVIIGIGKGNEDWNCSAPHGAGRLLSRSKAKADLSMEDFKKDMSGIQTWSVCRETIDESPAAYKPAEMIIEQVKDTIDIVDIIKPIYNFKAHGVEKTWAEKKAELKNRQS